MIRMFAPFQIQPELYKMVEKVQFFLKGAFVECHIDKDEEGYHNNEFALTEGKRNCFKAKEVTCRGYVVPFAVMGPITDIIPTDREDATEAVEVCGDNFQQYYAHLHRVKRQQRALETIASEIVEGRLHKRAIILADYKMKFEPVRFREKTSEFFVKRGVSWHGMVVFHLESVYDDDGNYKGSGHLSMLYYDHIVLGDS